jgi:hypothetical protein
MQILERQLLQKELNVIWLSTASKSMDTGKPYLFSSGTSLTIQVFNNLDMHPREVPQAPVVTTQGCYRYLLLVIIIANHGTCCEASWHTGIQKYFLYVYFVF